MSDFQKIIIERAERIQAKYQQMHAEFESQFKKDAEQLAGLLKACVANDPEAIRLLMLISHLRHPLPEPLSLSFETQIDPVSRIALCTFEIPDFTKLHIVKKRGTSLER